MALTGAQRRMLLIGVVPLVLLVVAGAAVTVATIRGKLPFNYSSTFAAGPQGVRIFSDLPTSVIGGSGDRVRVMVDGTYAAQQPKVEVQTVDGVLDVRTTCPEARCAVDLTVEVPANAVVQAKAEGTSLSLSGLAANVQVDASQGSVSMNRMRSQQVSVDARSGSLSMQFEDPPAQVTATASDGSISVRVPGTTTYSIDAVAARGSTEIRPINDPDSTHRLFLRTSYGSIDVS
ncbi:DUF4097 family beta strand repeat-containing protein [Kribbella sp. NPDC005582]|uniref:DUF4097 family beta strand repeat-containing protein n=1 Tax=Kribbella sp. NPDC005582 TaxID=3156893 RepID=UPI0033AA4A08